MTKHSMGRRPAKHSDEYDVVTGWRHFLCYMQRAGVTSAVKKRMNRRERRQSKRNLWYGEE
jgi:hypothetical protein